jgi:transcription initiation factor TFIIF subunit beta
MDEDIDDLSSSDDEQYFDIENQDNKVWLVKIPTFVAERWSSITEPGVELGSLRIYKQGIPNPTKQGELLQKIKLHIGNPDNEIPIPQNYNLTITNLASQNQFVFTESFEGKAVAVLIIFNIVGR